MLLTIRTTHRPATDLGFLLQKHPEHVHTREFPFGTATVFYPEATEEGCSAAVVLDVDPVGMVRGACRQGGAEDQYVNDLLDIEDVRGQRLVTTGLHRTVTIREENAAAALEVMSRFAANPKWLIYLPPTMSPSETSKREGLLEHPAEAFAYDRASAVSHAVVEQKHMGSRAISSCAETRRPHASGSGRRSQPSSWFQLAKMPLTISSGNA